MNEGTSLIQTVSNRRHQEGSLDNEEEPPGNSLQFKDPSQWTRDVRDLNRFTAVVLPFAERKLHRTSAKTKAFRHRFFPNTSEKQWNDCP